MQTFINIALQDKGKVGEKPDFGQGSYEIFYTRCVNLSKNQGA